LIFLVLYTLIQNSCFSKYFTFLNAGTGSARSIKLLKLFLTGSDAGRQPAYNPLVSSLFPTDWQLEQYSHQSPADFHQHPHENVEKDSESRNPHRSHFLC